MSIEYYTIEFKIILKCELVEMEDNIIAYYIEGLKPSINNVVQL